MAKKSNVKMSKHKILLMLVGIGILIFLIFASVYLSKTNIQVLNPKGPIALQEYHLIIGALLLSLLVVIPVFTLTIVFAFKYRETNKDAKYSPNLDGNRFAETVWWIIPTVLISILGVITWNSSHTLDPYRGLNSNVKPITIQVVALNWKWLFIYPKQNIATVNYFEIPKNTPINFQITSDAPMNSFWIPQLSGQIYAMPGMNTQLNLLASSTGMYDGYSANISGTGFSGMTFTAIATNQTDFNDWVSNVQTEPNQLNIYTYNNLAKPSINNPKSDYASAEPGLYNTIINRYMIPPDGVLGNSETAPLKVIQTNVMNMQGMQME